jgi:hypothetical protein
VGAEAGTPFTKTDGTVSKKRIPKYRESLFCLQKGLFFQVERFIIKNDQGIRKMENERWNG